MICAGVDVGSITAKAAVYDSESGRVLGTAGQLTGWSPREAGEAALTTAVRTAGLRRGDLVRVVGTGYGRVALPFADETVTFSCAKPVHLLPAGEPASGLLTIIDIGLDFGVEVPALQRLDRVDVASLWPVPGVTDDKYSRGVLGIIAGSENYSGAAVLAVCRGGCRGPCPGGGAGLARRAGHRVG